MRTIPVESTGRFKLNGIDLTGQATLIATGIGKNDHPEGWLTLDTVTYNPAKLSDSLFVVSAFPESDQRKLKSYYSINEAIRRKYKLSDTINLGEVNIISEQHKDFQTFKTEESRLKYVKPDAELIVTEPMESYPNIPELIRGKIPGVEVLGPIGGPIYNLYSWNIYPEW